ncbi:MAG: SIR2 family protein [Ignavibacteria bacterium]
MNILLFLGSGVSYKTGLPDTKTITETILNGDWWMHTDSNFYRGKHNNEYFDSKDITPKLQKLLRYIKEYSDKYLLSRNTSEANYEDIFYIVKQVHNETSHESDNPAIELFIRHLEEKFKFESNPDFRYYDKFQTLKDIAWKCADFMNCAVWDLLSTQNQTEGFGLIREITKDKTIEKVDIATLNHDLLIENYLTSLNLKYIDGFTEPDGDFCYFIPRLFKKEETILKLFKLHGSLQWYRLRDYDKEKNITTDFYAKVLRNHWYCKNAKGDIIGNTLESYPIFLTGSYNKLPSYSTGIFRHIHEQFIDCLYNTNILLMSGYGWNDRGINIYLFEWVLSSPDRKLILLHEDPESIKKSKSAMWYRYDDLIKWGRLIPVKKWMSDTKLEDISKYLN